MKIAFIGIVFLLSGQLVAKECITSPKNYSTAETAVIKRHFSERWLKNHEKTFAIKILPRLRLEDGVLSYQYSSCTPKARINLSKCTLGTTKLMIDKHKAAYFKCDTKKSRN